MSVYPRLFIPLRAALHNTSLFFHFCINIIVIQTNKEKIQVKSFGNLKFNPRTQLCHKSSWELVTEFIAYHDKWTWDIFGLTGCSSFKFGLGEYPSSWKRKANTYYYYKRSAWTADITGICIEYYCLFKAVQNARCSIIPPWSANLPISAIVVGSSSLLLHLYNSYIMILHKHIF